jgi:Glycosyl transferase family 2
MRVAAVTMVYNEPDYIIPWCRYYGGQVGLANCHVIDHGSNDGSTSGLGAVNVIRHPRSPMDDVRRARTVSNFCSDLLWNYESVIYVDVDEFLVPDPRHYKDLKAAVAAVEGDTVNSIGLEVLHLTAEESDIDINLPISLQRHWVWFNSALCKPSIMRRPFEWAPGFHCAPGKVRFDNIFLFHLRYFDKVRGLSRLAKTRQMPWADPNAGSHQKMTDEEWLRRLRDFGSAPKALECDLDKGDTRVAELLNKVANSSVGRENDIYNYDLSIFGSALWPIPERYRGIF